MCDASNVSFQAIYGGMGAFTGTAGVGIVNKGLLPMFLDFTNEEVMHHPVPEIGSEDLAGLGAEIDKADRASGAIASRVQLIFEFEQVFGLVHLEAQGVQGAALAAAAVQICPVQVIGIKARAFRHGLFTVSRRHYLTQRTPP